MQLCGTGSIPTLLQQQLIVPFISVIYRLPLVPDIAPILNDPSSSSAKAGNLASPSSPKRNAVLSRLGPEIGRLPDFRNGDEDFGGDDLGADPEETSGSSIQAKFD